ncbi:MAG: hypothetical protein HY514_00230 [Candidatus Aenigmarchaeota archaeon]|nr:hypothetical protein [Candidatus Aenigmarchaeota archaeon]
MMMANIAAFPRDYQFHAWSEAVKLYTTEPQAYMDIANDPFICDRAFILSRILASTNLPEHIENDPLYFRKMSEETDFSKGPYLKAIDSKDPRWSYHNGDIEFPFYLVSALEGERVFLSFFKKEPSHSHTENWFIDAAKAEIEDIEKQRKLEESASLSVIKYLGIISLPHEWRYVDLGPLITEKIKNNYAPLELIRA